MKTCCEHCDHAAEVERLTAENAALLKEAEIRESTLFDTRMEIVRIAAENAELRRVAEAKMLTVDAVGRVMDAAYEEESKRLAAELAELRIVAERATAEMHSERERRVAAQEAALNLTVERDKYKAFAEQGAAESAPALARVCQFLGWPIFGDHVEMAEKLEEELAELRSSADEYGRDLNAWNELAREIGVSIGESRISGIRRVVAELREDRARLDAVERKEWHIHSWREKWGEGGWAIWWAVTKRSKSISGHPQPSLRSAIDAARKETK